VLEIAKKTGRKTFLKAYVKFLDDTDDTVAGTMPRLERNHSWRQALLRINRF
jgi:hypothetical protein